MEPHLPDLAIANYQSKKGPRAGLLFKGRMFDAARVLDNTAYATVEGVLADWRNFSQSMLRLHSSGRPTAVTEIKNAKLLAPVLRPSAIYCAGANYFDHIEEMEKVLGLPKEEDPRTLGLKPWHFIKASRSIVGPDAPVALPAFSEKIDWEAELAVVIGIQAKCVSVGEAMGCVAGYTVANDLSARDHVFRPQVPVPSPFRFDWVSQKSWDNSCPLGPWIVPASEIAKPQELAITLTVNGVIKQQSNTQQMIYSVADQISHLSTRMTLYPGDIILTGTPAGVGLGRGEFLKSGDVVDVSIEKIGTLRSTIA